MTATALDRLSFALDLSAVRKPIDDDNVAWDAAQWVRNQKVTRRIRGALQTLNTFNNELLAGVERLGVDARFLNAEGRADRWTGLMDDYTNDREKLDAVVKEELDNILREIPDPGPPELEDGGMDWAQVHMPIFRNASPAEVCREWQRLLEKGELAKARLFALQFSGQTMHPTGDWDVPDYRGALNQLQQLTQHAIDSRRSVRAHTAAQDFVGTLESQYASVKVFADSVVEQLKKAAMGSEGVTDEIRQHILADTKVMADFGNEFTQPAAKKND